MLVSVSCALCRCICLTFVLLWTRWMHRRTNSGSCWPCGKGKLWHFMTVFAHCLGCRRAKRKCSTCDMLSHFISGILKVFSKTLFKNQPESVVSALWLITSIDLKPSPAAGPKTWTAWFPLKIQAAASPLRQDCGFAQGAASYALRSVGTCMEWCWNQMPNWMQVPIRHFWTKWSGTHGPTTTLWWVLWPL